MDRLARLRRRLRRTVLARRRLLAAVLAGVSVLAALRAVAEPAPATQDVLVAARDLPGGTVLVEADLGVAPFDPGLVPRGSRSRVDDLLGRTVAAPLRRGEPVTDVRLVGAELLTGYPGRVAVPVRLGDAAAAGLLTVGDTVTLVAAEPQAKAAVVVVERAAVVAIPAEPQGLGASTPGALVVVAVPPAAAGRLAQASASAFVSPVLVG